jgi:hypothetical protein
MVSIGMVSLVMVVCWKIAGQRDVAARRILEFAAMTGSAVVIYSARLSLQCP